MTPEDVVARARTLEDQEVLLTVRGTVKHFAGDQWGVYRGMPFTVMLNNPDGVHSDLVSIEPAPLRIKSGELYGDNDSEVYQGNPDGSLSAFGIKGKIDPEQVEGLRLLKVVNA